VPLPSETLDPAYRASLRRLAQANARAVEAEGALLHTLGRLLGLVQEVQAALELLHRERSTQQAGHEIAIAHPHLAHGNHD
jgi:uridine phosphorylase